MHRACDEAELRGRDGARLQQQGDDERSPRPSGGGDKDLLEAYRLAQHFGQRGFVRWCEGGPLLGSLYQRGQWDEVAERADAFLARLGDEGHYQAGSSHLFRGSIRAARGDDAGAVEDAARALELSRPVGDPQLSGTTLLGAAFIYMTVGDAANARKLFEESLALLGELGQLGWVALELHSLALGWAEARAERRAPRGSEGRAAAVALAARRSCRCRTATLSTPRTSFGEVGDVTAEAFYRLCAAEELVAEGHRAEADEQLRPRWRSTGRSGRRVTCAREKRCSPPVPSSMRAS